MNFLKIFCGFLLVFINIGCDNQSNIPDDIKKTYPKALSILISNPLDIAKDDAEVKLNVEKIKEKEPQFNEKAFIVWSGLKEIPSQVVDADDDKQSDFITFVLNLAPHEQNEISFLFSTDGEVKHDYKKRTQAELSHKFGGEFVNRKYVGGGFQNVSYLKLPPEHTDHSDFIRYEGPGWESDKVGYRFYLDWRNAIDIFGKKVSNMVLKNVGHDEYDSYHNPADWGMDILKVGESLGVGSIAMETCQVVMGFTELELGSVWNTMPPHTHERRMEVYMYFAMASDSRIFHLMGPADETRHLVVANGQAVVSPSWSLHSGVGTGAYTFCWGMGGENQTFDDMDHISIGDLR